jgi:hypothetical protein
MADNAGWRKVVKGHGMKGRWYKIKLKTFEDPTIVTNARWQNLPLLEFLIFFIRNFGKKIPILDKRKKNL